MYNKNDEVELNIIDITDEGLGVAKNYGQVFFVKDALPYDKVKAVITKITKNIIYAKCICILEESKYRVKSKCEIADSCGGCQLLKLDYKYQLEYKKKLIIDKLLKIGGVDVTTIYDEMIGIDKPCHFRNKMQVPFIIDKDNNVRFGFYAGRTHCVIPFKYCMVGFKGAELILNIIKDEIIKNNISIYNEQNNTGIFREVYLRVGNNINEMSIVYIINDKDYKKNINLYKMFDENIRTKYNDLKSGCEKKYNIVTTAININVSDNNVILGNTNVILYGNGYISDSIGDIKYQISIESFYQVNIKMTEKLYNKVVEYGDFKNTENVLDLFSGIGTISLYIAKYVHKVTGVEIVNKAVNDAGDNAKLNNITNADFKCIDLYKTNLKSYLKNETYDTIIVDPPRKGLDQNTIDLIIDFAPKKLIYVSCDPGTLARDIKILAANNYHMIKISNVDMFPHTTHIESVVLLINRNI